MIGGCQGVLESQNSALVNDKAITRVNVDEEGYSHKDVIERYIAKNIPFILTGNACVDSNGKPWSMFKEWLILSSEDEIVRLDTEHLIKTYGDETVPVADCNKEEYGAHPKMEMSFADYLHRIRHVDDSNECLYLKDYHFMRALETRGVSRDNDNTSRRLYETPACFTSDWLNEYCIDKGIDDYRFVYIGPQGSWTPFHADVLRSFSWSANICGKKLWILYPPGKENLLKDQLGNLPFSVAEEPFTFTDQESYQHRIEVIQNSGEIIFVPSGWHHQVHNLELTLSVNHNWFNGRNIEHCWRYLQRTLLSVQSEISDCRDMEDWHEHCQVLLRAYLGFNYTDFFTILTHVAEKRMSTVREKEGMDSDAVYDVRYNVMHDAMYDLQRVLHVMKLMWSDDHIHLIHELNIKQWVDELENAVTE